MDLNDRSRTTEDKIIRASIPILAREGYEGASIRKIAEACKLEPSVIYYHFTDKEALMRAVRTTVNCELDEAIVRLTPTDDVSVMLRQRIAFSIDHIEEIVCLLQYFLSAKEAFPQSAGGFVPERAYKYIYDVLQRGIADGRYTSDDPLFESKLIVHLINGFLLEYYPHPITKRTAAELVDKITAFVERRLTNEACA